MKFIELKCPNCKAPIQVEEGTRQWFCGHCGTRLLLDDGVKRTEQTIHYDKVVTHRNIDEAEVLRANIELQERIAKTEKEKKIWDDYTKSKDRWRVAMTVFGILGVVIGAFGALLCAVGAEEPGLIGVSIAFFMIVGVYIAKPDPPKVK